MERGGAGAQLRKAGPRLWLLLIALVVALLFFPVRNEITRLALLAAILGVWAGGLLLFWKNRMTRALLIGFAVAAVGLLLLPGRKADPESLRRAYIGSLKSYAGTPYVWGGETRTGIDCSGLVRQGMVNAYWVEGLRTANGALLREGVALWWDDSSARALGEEFHGRTVVQQKIVSLNDLDYQNVEPGDLAVVASGVHVLAYMGNKEWVQANPQAGRVILTPVPSNDPYFSADGLLVRWHSLSEAPQ